MKKIDVKLKNQEEIVHLAVRRSVEEEAQRIANLLGITTAEFVETIVADYIQNFEEPEDYDQEQQSAIEREESIKRHWEKITERFQYD